MPKKKHKPGPKTPLPVAPTKAQVDAAISTLALYELWAMHEAGDASYALEVEPDATTEAVSGAIRKLARNHTLPKGDDDGL